MTAVFSRTFFLAVLAFLFAESSGKSFLPLSKSNSSRISSEGIAIRPQPRIIEGIVARPNVAPYIGSLSVSNVAYGHECAVSLINKVWSITAAHCLPQPQGNKTLDQAAIGLPIYAGLKNRNDLTAAQVRHIDFAITHKNFNGKEGSEDIALLHVSPPFEFNENVSSIALPLFHEDFLGQKAITYGWGLENTDATAYVNDLRFAQGDVLNSKECRKQMPEDAPISPRTICSHVPSCYGDGGSPLAIESNGYPLTLIGITSWAYVPCGSGNRPTAFMATSHYVDWITQVQTAYSTLYEKN